MYDLYFNSDHDMFRKSVKDFFNKEVIPYIDIWEKEQCIPREIWKKMGEMGYLGLDFGTDVGGVGLDFFYTVVWAEEISKCFSGGFAIAPLVNSYMAAPYIYKYGSDFLKQKYVVPAIQGDQICSIAITEPAAGSDVANIQPKAVLTGDY